MTVEKGKDVPVARSREEDRFIDEVRRIYEPVPLSPARRVALRNAIEGRLPRRSKKWLFVPALASAAAVVAALVLISPAQAPTPAPVLAWEEDLFYSEGLLLEASVDLSEESLPPEYEAISEYFLGI